MPEPNLQFEQSSQNEDSDMEAVVGSIKSRLNKAKEAGGNTLGQRAHMKKMSQKESIDVNKKERRSTTGRKDLPERPTSRDKKTEKRIKIEKKPKNKERLGDISKLINIGDPVIPDSVSSELDAEGSWFFADFSEEDEDKLHIIYKAPDGAVIGDDEVTWEKITPRYESAQEYEVALKRLRERYEEEKAKDDGSEAYQKHLAQLILQVRHFAKIFRRQHENQVEKG